MSSRPKRSLSVRVRKAMGFFSVLTGAVLVAFWFYFAVIGRESFARNFWDLFVHVTLELASGVTLVVAGVGMLRGWRRARLLLISAVGLQVGSTFLALLLYGSMERPVLMDAVAIGFMVFFAYFAALVYAWEHFVLHLDEGKKRQSAQASR